MINIIKVITENAQEIRNNTVTNKLNKQRHYILGQEVRVGSGHDPILYEVRQSSDGGDALILILQNILKHKAMNNQFICAKRKRKGKKRYR